jgi:hypothetical protein
MGPFVGGFVTQHKGRQWSQYTLAIIAFGAWIPVFLSEEHT